MMPSPTDQEQTPSPEALEAAREIAESWNGIVQFPAATNRDIATNDIALALDRIVERRVRKERAQGRREGLEEAAKIALSERGQIAGCPERDDLCGDLAQRYRALAQETTDEAE